ncbi:MAG: mersacidin/lichenicidin family type 2 lantibiotic [Polyangiaceae bacterium]
MSKIDIARAWKDEDYRQSLTEAQRASLPANPAGAIELSEVELSAVAGGITTGLCTSSTVTSCKNGPCC